MRETDIKLLHINAAVGFGYFFSWNTTIINVHIIALGWINISMVASPKPSFRIRRVIGCFGIWPPHPLLPPPPPPHFSSTRCLQKDSSTEPPCAQQHAPSERTARGGGANLPRRIISRGPCRAAPHRHDKHRLSRAFLGNKPVRLYGCGDMAEAELETFTSIMDALVRISVSMMLIFRKKRSIYSNRVRLKMTHRGTVIFCHPTTTTCLFNYTVRRMSRVVLCDPSTRTWLSTWRRN